MKICSRCKKEKQLSEFYNRPKGKKQSWCIECARLSWDKAKDNNRSYEILPIEKIKEIEDIEKEFISQTNK